MGDVLAEGCIRVAHASALSDVARNVLTGEMKYFLSNRVPGERGVTLRRLLCVAFCRWSVESCFREAKEERGLDHYEVRGWRCVHRHFYVTQLKSPILCSDTAGVQPIPNGIVGNHWTAT